MEYFDNKRGEVILKNLLADVRNMSGGSDRLAESFSHCVERLIAKKPTLSEGLYLLGLALVGELGGSAGPTWGTLFIEMSGACTSSHVNQKVFLEMLGAAVQELGPISRTGSCAESLLSVLLPLEAVFQRAASEDSGFAEALAVLRREAREITGRGACGPDERLCAAVFESMSTSILSLIGSPLDNDPRGVL